MALGISVEEIIERSNNPLLKVHPSWQRVLLRDVAEILNGFAFKSSKFNRESGVPLLRIRDIGKSKTEVLYKGDFDEAYFVRSGDLVVGMDGDFNCARWTGPEALLNQRVCKITLKSPYYSSKFLEFALPGYLKEINDNTSSVTVKHLSSRTIAEIPLPFPPLSEQELIVAKIEELFTQLEAGTAALRRAQAGLKRYKASVLKAAVEGRLVEQDPSEEPAEEVRDNIKKTSLIGENFSSLPEGWYWATVEQIASSEPGAIQSGPFGSDLLHSEFQDSGILAIGIDNVLNNKFSLGKEHRISHKKYNQLRKFTARPLDVLITVMATVGRCCVIPPNLETAIITKHVYRISVEESIVDPYYLMYNLSGGEEVRKQLFGQVRGQTRPGINGAILRSIAIPLPPLMEQRRIVDEIDRRLSVIAEVDLAVEAGLRRANRLRQAILKRAFEGRLA